MSGAAGPETLPQPEAKGPHDLRTLVGTHQTRTPERRGIYKRTDQTQQSLMPRTFRAALQERPFVLRAGMLLTIEAEVGARRGVVGLEPLLAVSDSIRARTISRGRCRLGRECAADQGTGCKAANHRASADPAMAVAISATTVIAAPRKAPVAEPAMMKAAASEAAASPAELRIIDAGTAFLQPGKEGLSRDLACRGGQGRR